MAMNRAQFAKMLELALNTLFGLEYDTYPPEYEAVFEANTSQKAFEEDVLLTGFGGHQQKMKVQVLAMIVHHNSGLQDISMKQ